MARGDLILAERGFLIHDIVPKGVSVNIPPFLQNGKFTASEVVIELGVRNHFEK